MTLHMILNASPFFPSNDKVSPEAIRLIKELLAKPVKERISDIESIMDHPWLKDYSLPACIE